MKAIKRIAARGQQSAVTVAVGRALRSAGFLAGLAATFAAGTALAQEKADATDGGAAAADGGASLQEVTVTGSRIHRADGYEAPTPVSVLGNDQLKQMATATIAESVNRLPAFAGSLTPSDLSSNVGTGTAGVNALNLRSLGANRTLVLLDGKRMVGSSLGTGGNASAVDVNTIPSDLVERVEVVTGGASAVYGSDALAGVVNFILDKKFTGIKGSIEGGETGAGDGGNYKADLTFGTPFASGRGHLLLSGELTQDEGVIGNDRSWADDGYQMMMNPNYVAGNGQPALLTVHNASVANGTRGGLVLSCSPNATGTFLPNSACPLRGTQFVNGGLPVPFQFGNLVNGPIMSGGDWQSARIDRTTSLELPLARRNVFGRASFDVTDNVNVYTELMYSYTYSHNAQVVPNLDNGDVTIKSDNAFLPTSLRNAMIADGIQRLQLGTFNGDMPYLQGINQRELKRYVAGAEGDFHLGSTDWKWDSFFSHSAQEIISKTPGDRINANYQRASDAVVGPNGQIICRVNDTADPAYNPATAAPGCVPYNTMGLGVNSQAAINYVTGMGDSGTTLKQDVVGASANAEPFSTWAGKVSIALGAEHRRESVDGYASALDQLNSFFAGNYHPTSGAYHVTEGFLETVVPLVKNVPMFQMLDFNGGVRETDYSTSGRVTTWKVGGTWTPVDDIRFRVTRSRDIRAPNLGELYNAGQSGTGNNFDPFLKQSYFMLSRTSGNINLKPEEADTTGIGFVLTPRFVPGFTMSVDYYNIDINGAIATTSATNILNSCFAGNQLFCAQIQRGANGQVSLINVQPQNVLSQKASGIDLDASYNIRMPIGEVVLRGMASFVSKLQTADPVAGIIDGRGVNSSDGGTTLGTGLAAPRFRFLTSATYNLDPVAVTLTMRGISAGKYNNSFITCQVDCPVSTTANYTINNNHIDSVKYFDLAVNYSLGKLGEVFVIVENIADQAPPPVAGGINAGFYQGESNQQNYDRIGRNFHAGWRFKF